MGDRYRLEDLLGVGGSAQVWRAIAVDEPDEPAAPNVPVEGTEVAVKLLHPYLLPDGGSKVRLIAEARAVRQLRHPGIVQLRDVVMNDAEVALVFDYVSGGSLAELTRRTGRLEPRRAAELAAEIADALAYAHGRGVVHRDVTPGNVLLDESGNARLADFGIARLLEESAATVTMTGTVLGTLRYMAPEQLAGHEVDGRADVYSLGAVLYEMLAGRPPYDARTPVALVEQHASPPPALPAETPEPLAAIAYAALRPRAADRPTSADIADALHAWLSGTPVVAPWLDAAGEGGGTKRLQRVPEAARPGSLRSAGAAVEAGAATGAGGSGGSPVRGVVGGSARGATARSGHVGGSTRGTAWPLVAALLVAALIAALAFAVMTDMREKGSQAVAPATGVPALAVPTGPASPSPSPAVTASPTPTPAPVVLPPKPGPKSKHHGHG